MNTEEIQELVTRFKTPLVNRFPKLNSSHEGMAVIRLYSDKLWESVKNPFLVKELQKQAACVSAAALHFLDSVCGVTNSMELAVFAYKACTFEDDCSHKKCSTGTPMVIKGKCICTERAR